MKNNRFTLLFIGLLLIAMNNVIAMKSTEKNRPPVVGIETNPKNPNQFFVVHHESKNISDTEYENNIEVGIFDIEKKTYCPDNNPLYKKIREQKFSDPQVFSRFLFNDEKIPQVIFNHNLLFYLNTEENNNGLKQISTNFFYYNEIENYYNKEMTPSSDTPLYTITQSNDNSILFSKFSNKNPIPITLKNQNDEEILSIRFREDGKYFLILTDKNNLTLYGIDENKSDFAFQTSTLNLDNDLQPVAITYASNSKIAIADKEGNLIFVEQSLDGKLQKDGTKINLNDINQNSKTGSNNTSSWKSYLFNRYTFFLSFISIAGFMWYKKCFINLF